MKRTEDDPEVGGPCYTLYLEYLGGLVPILKGRRISKLRPEFVIMDPKTDGKAGRTELLLCIKNYLEILLDIESSIFKENLCMQNGK